MDQDSDRQIWNAMMSGVIGIWEELLGPNHPNTRTARGNLEVIQQKFQG